MSKNTQKMLRNSIFYLSKSYSHSLVVLPYGYQVSEDCLRQSLHRAETGILKNSVNISMGNRAERRLKKE